MILILKPHINPGTDAYQKLESHLARLQNIELRIHQVEGVEQTLTEIYLIGNTAALIVEDMRSLPGVDHVVRARIEAAVDDAIRVDPPDVVTDRTAWSDARVPQPLEVPTGEDLPIPLHRERENLGLRPWIEAVDRAVGEEPADVRTRDPQRGPAAPPEPGEGAPDQDLPVSLERQRVDAADGKLVWTRQKLCWSV